MKREKRCKILGVTRDEREHKRKTMNRKAGIKNNRTWIQMKEEKRCLAKEESGKK